MNKWNNCEFFNFLVGSPIGYAATKKLLSLQFRTRISHTTGIVIMLHWYFQELDRKVGLTNL